MPRILIAAPKTDLVSGALARGGNRLADCHFDVVDYPPAPVAATQEGGRLLRWWRNLNTSVVNYRVLENARTRGFDMLIIVDGASIRARTVAQLAQDLPVALWLTKTREALQLDAGIVPAAKEVFTMVPSEVAEVGTYLPAAFDDGLLAAAKEPARRHDVVCTVADPASQTAELEPLAQQLDHQQREAGLYGKFHADRAGKRRLEAGAPYVGAQLTENRWPDAWERLLLYRGAGVCLHLHAAREVGAPLDPQLFEILGSGRPLLCAPHPELAELFDTSRDLALYSDPVEMGRELNRLLDEGAADALGLAGQEAVLASHTYTDRAATILERVLGITPERRSDGPG